MTCCFYLSGNQAHHTLDQQRLLPVHIKKMFTNKGDRGLGHLMMTIAQVGSKAGFFILGEEEIIY